MSRIVASVHLSGMNQFFQPSVRHALGRMQTWIDSYMETSCASLLWTGDSKLTGGNLSPNTSAIGPWKLVLDGFIYNREELQVSSSLEDSDAKVFLLAIEKYGFRESLSRINGDFSVACFDERDNSLWCARDRVGARPLYYSRKSNSFLLASTLGALLALGVSPEINPVFTALFAGSHYRTIDNNVHNSPFNHIHQLPAGHMLYYRSGEYKLSCWWTPQEDLEFIGTEEELAEEYREIFIDAVRLRLNRMEKVLFTLSGGMDSSAILSTARFITGNKQHALSSVYDDATFDESEQISAMLAENVSDWTQVRIGTPDIFDTVTQMISAHNEPVATATWLPHWFVCKKAAEIGCHAVTSGLGGDELFGGEYEHFFFYFADLRSDDLKGLYNSEVAMWAKNHDHPLYPKNFAIAEETLRRRTGAKGYCLPDMTLFLRYASAVSKDFYDLQEFEMCMDHPFSSYLKNRCWQDIFRETTPCCIRAQDRQGGSFGLVTIMPFFDPRLIDFMFRLPKIYKIRHGVNKYLARRAMRGILPNATCDNIVKTGWNAPAHLWFSGKNKEALMDMINSQSFKERGIYRIDEVERIVREHSDIVNQNLVKENHMMFLWQLINIEIWMRWIDTKGWDVS